MARVLARKKRRTASYSSIGPAPSAPGDHRRRLMWGHVGLASDAYDRQYGAMTDPSWTGRKSITFGEYSAEMAKPKQPPIRWHYTNYETLPLILENHALWATNVEFLNDTDEIKLGIKRVKQHLSDHGNANLSPKNQDSQLDLSGVRELIEDWEDFPYSSSAFTTSFSRDGDDNSQWDRYAGRNGFAIGIREGSHLPILGEGPAGGGNGAHVEDEPLRWASMVYSRRKQTALIERALGSMHDGMTRNAYPGDDVDMSSVIRDQAISEYVMAAARIKNRGFRAEREVRYIVSQPRDTDAIHRRRGPYGADTTFIKLTGAPDGADEVFHPGDRPMYQPTPVCLPIVKVRLGPALKGEADVREVEELLAGNGYHGVKVVRSCSTQR